MLTQHQAQMIGFARATLQILESDENWSADTLDEIANAARRAELAYADGDALMFRIKESAK